MLLKRVEGAEEYEFLYSSRVEVDIKIFLFFSLVVIVISVIALMIFERHRRYCNHLAFLYRLYREKEVFFFQKSVSTK